jgi:hypothetical protein
MYKFMLTALLAFCFVFSYLHAGKIDDILAKNYEASGSEKGMAINSSKVTGKINAMGQDMGFTYYSKKSGKFKLELSTPMGNMIMAYNDSIAWASQGGQIQDIPVDMAKGQASQFDFSKNIIESMKNKGDSISLIGRETVDSIDCYKIGVKSNDGKTTIVFINAKDYLLYKMGGSEEQQGQTINYEVTFSDYKNINGIKVPFKMSNNSGMMKSEVILEKVETNIDISDTIFEKSAK